MFLLTDLATTTSENTGISLTITPESALDKDYVIRYFITGVGLNPASTGSLLLSSGSLDFASGSTAPITTTIGRTINNLVKDYSKDVSVKVASYEVNEENGVRTESNETVLVEDHRVTITDTIIKPINGKLVKDMSSLAMQLMMEVSKIPTSIMVPTANLIFISALSSKIWILI